MEMKELRELGRAGFDEIRAAWCAQDREGYDKASWICERYERELQARRNKAEL